MFFNQMGHLMLITYLLPTTHLRPTYPPTYLYVKPIYQPAHLSYPSIYLNVLPTYLSTQL
jgi:hypothetical protein